jgi:hypothetical protein
LFSVMMISQFAEGQARVSSNYSAAKSSRLAFSRIVGDSIVRGLHRSSPRWKTNATSQTRDLEISIQRGIFPVYWHPSKFPLALSPGACATHQPTTQLHLVSRNPCSTKC